jgi:hypothetical protein
MIDDYKKKKAKQAVRYMLLRLQLTLLKVKTDKDLMHSI